MTPDERKQFIADITEAIQSVPAVLSDDEQRWVRMAIQREAQSIDLRKAIIEKTLAGLAWAVIVGAGYLMMDFLKNHGFK
jgi:hypothetical protein